MIVSAGVIHTGPSLRRREALGSVSRPLLTGRCQGCARRAFPTGGYDSFAMDFGDADSDFISVYQLLETQVPDKQGGAEA